MIELAEELVGRFPQLGFAGNVVRLWCWGEWPADRAAHVKHIPLTIELYAIATGARCPRRPIKPRR
jgi:hypothetical protein